MTIGIPLLVLSAAVYLIGWDILAYVLAIPGVFFTVLGVYLLEGEG